MQPVHQHGALAGVQQRDRVRGGLLRRLLDARLNFSDPAFGAFSDQHFFNKALIDAQRGAFPEGEAIALDTGCRLFNSVFLREADLACTKHGWYNKAARSFPLVFHNNGQPKLFLWNHVIPTFLHSEPGVEVACGAAAPAAPAVAAVAANATASASVGA